MPKLPYKPTIRIAAELSRTAVTVSGSAAQKFPSGKVAIEGVVGSLPFQSSFESNDKGGIIRISPTLRKILRAEDGEEITLEITKVGDEPETRIPADLRKALAASPKAEDTWKDITMLSRRDWIFWIISGKKEETRSIRIKKAIDMLSSGKRRVCCFGGTTWMMKHPS